MKKVAAGFLAGVLVALSATAYADDIKSALGKAVDGTYPLIIDGKKSDRDVIVVDDTGYLPVRAAGELFGYKVDFVRDQVVLNKKKASGGTTSGGTITGMVSVKTSLFALSTSKGTLVERDGVTYISAMVFENNISSDGKKVTLTLPVGSKVEFDYNGAYASGVSGYNEDGLFVSLSALGLKAIPNGTAGILLVKK